MILEGKLVRLRPITAGDTDRFLSWINDDEVTRFLEQRYPASRVAEAAWIESVSKSSLPDGTLAMDTLDGRHIGSVALHDPDRESRSASFGILIGDKDYWSRGYGTDATRTLLQFAFDEINLNRIVLHVREDNLRAIAAYRRSGFVEEARLRQERFKAGRYWDTVVMAALADEFRATVAAA